VRVCRERERCKYGDGNRTTSRWGMVRLGKRWRSKAPIPRPNFKPHIVGCCSSRTMCPAHPTVASGIMRSFSLSSSAMASSMASRSRAHKHESLAHEASSPLPFSPVNRTTLSTTRPSTQEREQTTFPHSGRLERPAARLASPRWCRRTRWWCRPRLPSPLPSSCAPATTRR
jgi:hypothetical protein